MGLFIDDDAHTIAYQLFPGSNADTTALRPALEKATDSINFCRVIVVVGGGLNSEPNIAHFLSGGNGHILSKSTKKRANDVKKWILGERDMNGTKPGHSI
ncbi:MAG: hypothetical protein LBU32_00305 [Clostridiales bacterium]|jgi:predicted TIM-barrel enzyme|nr:hypothetical protein [Clostridiales bacterium]